MWKQYNPNPRGNQYAGDCVIRAITKALDTDWDRVYSELSVYGYSLGDWGNSNGVWDAYLRDIGFKRYVLPNSCPSCYTVSDFASERPKGTYILATGRHAVTVSDGDYYDSWDSGAEVPIYYYTKEQK